MSSTGLCAKLRTEDRGSRKRFRNNVLDLCDSREKAEGQRKSCKQGTLDSSNKGVMAEMDPFVASYYWFTNAGSDSALFKFRQLFWTVTNLRNHNIEHGTKEQRAGMPGLCYRINKQWISKEPIQGPPGNGSTMDSSLGFPPLVRRDGADPTRDALTPRRTGPLEL